MAYMSSRGWKLSAALIAVTITSTQAGDLQSLSLEGQKAVAEAATKAYLGDAIACTQKAATVYAELSEETARKVSELAHRKCREEWAMRWASQARMTFIDMQIEYGKQMPKSIYLDLLKTGSDEKYFNELTIAPIELAVVEWRAQAKLQGNSVYQEVRLRIDAQLEQNKAERGF